MDSFYCLVRIILNKQLSLYYLNRRSSSKLTYKIKRINYPICFTAKSAKNMIKLLSLHSYFDLIASNHAFYLGVELYKAELSLFLKQIYIQD